MENLERILFPVDLSAEVSIKIVPDVITMAKKFDAEIHLVFVTSGLEQYSTFYVPHPSLDQFEEEIKKGARRRLEDFHQEHFIDYPKIKSMLLYGDPAEEILKYIQTENIDFVILGTHGRKGLDRILFGSVAEQVVKGSPVPVMSVNPYKKSS